MDLNFGGGGDPQTLTAFDHLDVLNAFSKQPAYKIEPYRVCRRLFYLS